MLVCFFIPDILIFIKLPLVDLVVGTYNSIFLTTNNFVWWGIYFFIGILLNESKLKEKYSCFKVSYQWMIVIAIYLIYMCVYWIFGKKIFDSFSSFKIDNCWNCVYYDIKYET